MAPTTGQHHAGRRNRLTEPVSRFSQPIEPARAAGLAAQDSRHDTPAMAIPPRCAVLVGFSALLRLCSRLTPPVPRRPADPFPLPRSRLCGRPSPTRRTRRDAGPPSPLAEAAAGRRLSPSTGRCFPLPPWTIASSTTAARLSARFVRSLSRLQRPSVRTAPNPNEPIPRRFRLCGRVRDDATEPFGLVRRFRQTVRRQNAAEVEHQRVAHQPSLPRAAARSVTPRSTLALATVQALEPSAALSLPQPHTCRSLSRSTTTNPTYNRWFSNTPRRDGRAGAPATPRLGSARTELQAPSGIHLGVCAVGRFSARSATTCRGYEHHDPLHIVV